MNMRQAVPILYSFRRCPYAMRARLALAYSGITVELREVVLRAKPAELLAISPKATVPVLQTIDGQVIDQSLEIMLWALQQHDPNNWLKHTCTTHMMALIAQNDGAFKAQLDRYKYPERHPEHTQAEHRAHGEVFLQQLEDLLGQHAFLLANQPCLADWAIVPFIRQFAHVDQAWFDGAAYPQVQRWLDQLLQSSGFAQVMHKYPAWQQGTQGVVGWPEPTVDSAEASTG